MGVIFARSSIIVNYTQPGKLIIKNSQKLKNSQNGPSGPPHPKSIPSPSSLNHNRPRRNSHGVLMPHLLATFFIKMVGIVRLVFEISTLAVRHGSQIRSSGPQTPHPGILNQDHVIIVTQTYSFTPPREMCTNEVPRDAQSCPWPSRLGAAPFP